MTLSKKQKALPKGLRRERINGVEIITTDMRTREGKAIFNKAQEIMGMRDNSIGGLWLAPCITPRRE